MYTPLSGFTSEKVECDRERERERGRERGREREREREIDGERKSSNS
jgi:hypothetical protein